MNSAGSSHLRIAALALAALALLLVSCGSDASTLTTDLAASAAPTEAPVATTSPIEIPPEATAVVAAAQPADLAGPQTTLVPDVAQIVDTSAGIAAAQWGDNVTITISGDEWRFESDGIPSHELPDQFLVPQTGSFTPPVEASEVSPVDTSVAVVASPVDQTMTLSPVYSTETTDTSLGIIGVTISGAQLFNDYEDPDRAFVAVDDNFAVDGIFFVDSCNGHPLALLADGTGAGNYHYHGVPYCLTDIIDAEGAHSSILGFLVDGFPFYGPQDAGGVTITSDDLDECSGHYGATPEFPDGIYHYHLTEDRSPYTVDCYHGEVEQAATGQGGRPEAGQGPPPDGQGPPANGEAPAEGGPPPADGEAPAEGQGPPADGGTGEAPAEGQGPPADGEGPPEGGDGEGPPEGQGPPADGEGPPEGGGGGGGAPDFASIATTLGVDQSALEAALGQPPFDLAAAAATLGISEEALEAALPPRPPR